MSAIAAWFHSHAIDLDLAKQVGMRTESNTLFAPYERADGSTFERSRTFPGGKWMQPSGEELACWWPLGRARGGSVLLCEGEGDTLAAATVLDSTNHPTLNGICPVGLPGVTAVKRAAAELGVAWIKKAYICLDADENGRRATEKLQVLLPKVGVQPWVVELPKGGDLADWLKRADLGLGDLNKPYPPLAVPPVTVQLAKLIENAEHRPIYKDHRPSVKPLEVDDLRKIPATTWVSKLAGIPEPEPNTLIKCPLHDDKTPSCRINEDYFICFGCGEGGSVYDFSMALWDCDFRTARSRLTEIFIKEPVSGGRG